MKNSQDIKILFLGREFGLIVKDKLKEAGYILVDDINQADLLVVGFWGEIVKKDMLQKPKYGAVNVHPSLLPKYRGPTPVPSTILNGDAETGVTIIQLDEQVDHGPILAQEKFSIGEKKFTTPELRQILWGIGGDLLLDTIPKWIAGEITPQEQNHNKATFTKKLSREDGEIDWKQPVEYIDRQVRAFTPWPGAYTFWQDKRVKILKAHIEQDKLVIDELQLEGKKPTALKEFMLGHKDFYVGP